MTRRVMKPQPVHVERFWEIGGAAWSERISTVNPVPGHSLWTRMPFKPGDILYVRETWDYLEGWKIGDPGIEGKYFYRADGDLRPISWRGNWRPSIHMPKEAARIFLNVTNVRVERLQCMSWDDICNEGLIPDSDIRDKFSFEMLQNKFKNLWDSTIKKSNLDRYGWDASPWVWVIEFERCEKPE